LVWDVIREGPGAFAGAAVAVAGWVVLNGAPRDLGTPWPQVIIVALVGGLIGHLIYEKGWK
jgi:hypothetical protein